MGEGGGGGGGASVNIKISQAWMKVCDMAPR